MQLMIDSQSVVPVQSCIDADHYSLDELPAARHGVLLLRATCSTACRGASRTRSSAYNRAAFVKAGLDPNQPPQTLDEVKEYSQKIVATGAAKHGIALRVEPYIFEFLEREVGRHAREQRRTAATRARRRRPSRRRRARRSGRGGTTWSTAGLALNTGGAAGNIDHMLAIGTGDAAMTIEASGVLGTVKQVLESRPVQQRQDRRRAAAVDRRRRRRARRRRLVVDHEGARRRRSAPQPGSS